MALERFDYRVLREGKPVGHYRFDIVEEPEGSRVVNVRFDLAVKVLFITVYRVEHERTERWESGQLRELHGTSNYNGKRFDLALDCSSDECRFTVNGEARPVRDPVISFVPWPPRAWEPSTLITERGNVRYVDFRHIGRERIAIDGIETEGDHYRIIGDIERDLWYDDGRLLKASFERDGADIEIILSASLGS